MSSMTPILMIPSETLLFCAKADGEARIAVVAISAAAVRLDTLIYSSHMFVTQSRCQLLSCSPLCEGGQAAPGVFAGEGALAKCSLLTEGLGERKVLQRQRSFLDRLDCLRTQRRDLFRNFESKRLDLVRVADPVDHAPGKHVLGREALSGQHDFHGMGIADLPD